MHSITVAQKEPNRNAENSLKTNCKNPALDFKIALEHPSDALQRTWGYRFSSSLYFEKKKVQHGNMNILRRCKELLDHLRCLLAPGNINTRKQLTLVTPLDRANDFLQVLK